MPKSSVVPPKSPTTSAPDQPLASAPHAEGERFFVVSDLESAIEQLPGVIGVRIVAPEGEVEEIHVLAADHVKPKMVVRDIETLLQVKFHVRIDHRRISVVRTANSQAGLAARLVLFSVNRSADAQAPAVIATLRAGTKELQGIQSLSESPSELYASAQAVLSAVEQLLEARGVIKLLRLEPIKLDSRELIFTLVEWRGDLTSEILVGAALTGEDRMVAAARAALDAVNRKLIRLPTVASISKS